MKMTITEKILARASGAAHVSPGDNIWVNANVLLTHDICGPGTIGIFKREFGADAKVWDKNRIVIIPDHYIFTADSKAKRNIELLREFAEEQSLPYYYGPGSPLYKGVCHVALPECGHVRPGEVIFGTDSHTCTHGAFGAFATGIGNTDAGFVMGTGKLLIKVPATMRFRIEGELPPFVTGKDIILRIIGDIGIDGATYRAMEFCGSAISRLSMEDRMTVCNMAIEAGGKNGIIAPDTITFDYLKHRRVGAYEPVYGDDGAPVLKEMVYQAEKFEPYVAKPHLPSLVEPARSLRSVKLDRAYIGSCTGGKLSDFVMAAKIMKGRKVSVETFLVPATCEVALGLIETSIDGKSLVEIFAEAGCREIAPPSCAACLGGPEDTYGRTVGKEVVISTTNRNFVGRMGSKESSIYLASAMTVAASAVNGRITDPRDL